jgi:hypothetical protein
MEIRTYQDALKMRCLKKMEANIELSKTDEFREIARKWLAEHGNPDRKKFKEIWYEGGECARINKEFSRQVQSALYLAIAREIRRQR